MKGNKKMRKYTGYPRFVGALTPGWDIRNDEAGEWFRAKQKS